MKTLILVRHAKATNPNGLTPDQDRPLKDRGLTDAAAMGKLLNEQKIIPQVLIASPAVRALTTATILAGELAYPLAEIGIAPPIYEASLDDLLGVIRHLDERFQRVMLVGHNPGLSELCNFLVETMTDSLPTCGVAVFHVNAKLWKNVDQNTATLKNFEYPKKDSSD